MKRSKAEWGFEKLLGKKPSGVSTEPIEVDGNMLILQVTFPASYSNSQIELLEKWVHNLKKQLPKNVFVVCVTEDIDLNIHRPPMPKEVRVIVRDSVITGSKKLWRELMDRVEEFDQRQDLCYVTVDMSGCTLDFRDDEEEEQHTPVGPPGQSIQAAKSLGKHQKVQYEELHKELDALRCATCGALPMTPSCPDRCDEYH